MRHCLERRAGTRLLLCIPILFLAGTLGLAACGSENRAAAVYVVPGGDVAQGALAIDSHGCGACHVIPGIPGADSHVGPPLTDWAQRQYIAGTLPNTPENLVRWIQNPQAIEPGTAMPNMAVSDADARDIAAYLYSLD